MISLKLMRGKMKLIDLKFFVLVIILHNSETIAKIREG